MVAFSAIVSLHPWPPPPNMLARRTPSLLNILTELYQRLLTCSTSLTVTLD